MITVEEMNQLSSARGLIIGGAVIAAAAGFGAGYLFATNRLEERFSKKLAEELEAVGRVYKVYQHAKPETPEEFVAMEYPKSAAEALAGYQGSEPKPETAGVMPREAPPVYERARTWKPESKPGEVPLNRRNNIFDDAKPDQDVDFDYTEEERNRTEEAPYIIAQHEHGDNDFNQVTLTYYEGDGVLADERDDKYDDIDDMVGDDNIPRFGHRSNDDNVLYVRNHKYGLDIEIVRDSRKYSEVVHGFVDEE